MAVKKKTEETVEAKEVSLELKEQYKDYTHLILPSGRLIEIVDGKVDASKELVKDFVK